MNDDVVRNLKEPSHWLRVFFMLGFAIVLYVVGIVVLVITLAQLLFSLITGTDNPNLRSLGASLSRYVFEILQYLTYNTELKPFPFAPFPFVEAGTTAGTEPAGDAAPVEPVVTPAAPAATTASATTPPASTATPAATEPVAPATNAEPTEGAPAATESPPFTPPADDEEGAPR